MRMGYCLPVGVTAGVPVGISVGVRYLKRYRSYLWGGVGLEMPPRLDQFEEHDFQFLTLSASISTRECIGCMLILHTSVRNNGLENIRLPSAG